MQLAINSAISFYKKINNNRVSHHVLLTAQKFVTNQLGQITNMTDLVLATILSTCMLVVVSQYNAPVVCIDQLEISARTIIPQDNNN